MKLKDMPELAALLDLVAYADARLTPARAAEVTADAARALARAASAKAQHERTKEHEHAKTRTK